MPFALRDALAFARRFWWLLAAVAAVFIAIWAWEAIKAPFDWLGERFCVSGSDCRAARTQRELDRTRSDLDARNEEAEGRAVVDRQDDAARVVVLETRTIVTQAQAEAQGAPDAEIPVGPERDARARAVRERLCLAHPGTCAGSPPEG